MPDRYAKIKDLTPSLRSITLSRIISLLLGPFHTYFLILEGIGVLSVIFSYISGRSDTWEVIDILFLFFQ